MAFTTEFYDYLHELELDGSISRLDDDSTELLKLRILATESTFENKKANCIALLEKGYSKREVATEVKMSIITVSEIKKEAGIPRVPVFKYLVDDKFYVDLRALKRVFPISKDDGVIKSLKRLGHVAYYLHDCHWEQIPIGAMMITANGKVHVKKSHNIRTFDKF